MRNTVERLPQTVDRMRNTVERLPRTGDRFSKTVDHLPRTGDRFSKTVDHLPRTGDRFSKSVDHLPRTVVRMLKTVDRCPEPSTDSRKPSTACAHAALVRAFLPPGEERKKAREHGGEKEQVARYRERCLARERASVASAHHHERGNEDNQTAQRDLSEGKFLWLDPQSEP